MKQLLFILSRLKILGLCHLKWGDTKPDFVCNFSYGINCQSWHGLVTKALVPISAICVLLLQEQKVCDVLKQDLECGEK